VGTVASTAGTPLPDLHQHEASAGIFLVLRRMRIPLIVIVVVFALSVLGLSLLPGQDAQGNPSRMSLFESFYFMSYTATTIGYGELPFTFTSVQRMWVTGAIFASVIGWAYAVGSLLALLQDRAFRLALARRHFSRKVANLREPFVLLVGYGNTGKLVARSLDDLGRRFVVVVDEEERVTAVELASYRADTPALLADATDTAQLVSAGLGYRHCEGVIALAGDDEANLDVAMTTALLRPDLRVIARTSSRDVAERMTAFGSPEIVNPVDRFGDHLRILHRSPASYQLMMWLTSAPGTPLPTRRDPVPRGRWVVYGDGWTSRELTADLRKEGLEVTTARGQAEGAGPDHRAQEAALDAAGAEDAVAFVATTDDDMTNLWLIERVRELNPQAFLVSVQNRTANSTLFQAVGVDFGLIPADVVAHEVMARLATPVLADFLAEVPRHDGSWAADLVTRLTERCGTGAPDVWRVPLTARNAPALTGRLEAGALRLGDLIRDPNGRDEPLGVVPLALTRGDDTQMAPDDDALLRLGDELLLAGRVAAWKALDATLTDEPTAAYVIDDRFVPTGWLWRRLSGDRTRERV
jgi:Trk K+ transport system NAD-binding subunit